MNLLPSFTIPGAAKEENPTKWYPKAALWTTKDLSYLGVGAEESKQPPPLRDNSNQQSLLPPNERYVIGNNYSAGNPSPLGQLHRSAADPAEILLPAELTREPRAAKASQDDRKDLALGVYNMSASAPVQLFVHKGAANMQATSVGPGGYISKSISGRRDVQDENTLLCAVCLAQSALVRLSPSQMMRTFQFQQGPIGLELKDLNDHVICHRVVPMSQAAAHQEALSGAEIVTVNGTRILSLDNFQQLLTESSSDQVTLRAIVTVAAEPKTVKKKLSHLSLEKGAPSQEKGTVGPRSAGHKGEADSKGEERVVSQVKGIYRDEDENLVASVKHVRSSFDSSRREEEEEEEWGARAWNYNTAVNLPEEEKEEEDEEEQVPDSMHIACMPVGALKCSKRWGNPTSLLQISNLSAEWAVSVHWVDEEGVLIFRKMLSTGDRHMEMTSPHHLWALCAVPAASATPQGPISPETASLFLIRPCESSLARSKSSSLLWAPGRSLTASQRDLHPFDQLGRKTAPRTASEPLMHIQIL